jgi:valyl-tRNA synthetase
MSDALMATYKLVWDDFCAWYLEMIKPEFIDGNPGIINKRTYQVTIDFFESLLKVIHPWMPFISEEIWHLIKNRNEKDCIIISEWPKFNEKYSWELTQVFEECKTLITTIRNIRQQNQISPKTKLDLYVNTASGGKSFDPIIIKLANLSFYKDTDKKVEGAISFILKNGSSVGEFYIPLTQDVNIDEEKERIAKELEYNKGFLKSVQVKLANERFVANAKPELIELERKKQSDAEAKIKALEEQLKSL